MNQLQALEAARQIGVVSGDHIILQSEGMINHPHLHSGQISGPTHVDAWHVQNIGGSLQASKLHSDQ
ncbi:MAG TPA: hypothetical protein VFY36_01720 [Solirubrobacteraceae bacterium]|nr:hypothetical protein [Solirubrobacteraceae bacterium]